MTPDGTATKKILCIGDSIARGYRNSGKGFVGDLGMPYKNVALSSTTLSNAYTDALNIPAQLLAVTDYEPDIVVANGGINDYLRGAEMGTVPSAKATADRWGANPAPKTVMDGLECLLYGMKAKYPKAEHYFLLIHKVTRNGVDCTVTENAAGYTQTQLFENIKAVCALYGVEVIDVFGESSINTAYPEFVSPVKYADDNSVTYSEWVDADGLHPLAYGYLHGYMPIVRKALRLGGDDAIDPGVILDSIKGFLAENPYTMFRSIDDAEKYGRKTSNLTQDGAYFIYEPLWDDVPISKDGAATMLVAPSLLIGTSSHKGS
jgi:lysophospholipase L1-like esterase